MKRATDFVVGGVYEFGPDPTDGDYRIVMITGKQGNMRWDHVVLYSATSEYADTSGFMEHSAFALGLRRI